MRVVLERNQGVHYAGFDGAWEDQCDKDYCDSADLRTKCKKCPVSILGTCLTPAPDTAAGKLARGLPLSYSPKNCGTSTTPAGPVITVPVPGGSVTLPTPGAAGGTGVIGQVGSQLGGLSWQTMALIGGGILTVGAAAFLLGGRRSAPQAPRALAGYSRRRRARRMRA